MEPPQKTLLSSKVSILGLFSVLTLILAIPLVLLLSQQKQNLRSNASESTAVPSSNLGESQAIGNIAGYVYIDLNQNGDRDLGENPMPGVTVKITQVGQSDAFGKQTTTTTDLQTDANGYFLYKFPNTVRNGMTYLVKVVSPPGYKTTGT